MNRLALPNDNSAQKLEQSIEKTKSSSPALSRQCMGTTKAGQRCKRMTTDPSGYCYQHK